METVLLSYVLASCFLSAYFFMQYRIGLEATKFLNFILSHLSVMLLFHFMRELSILQTPTLTAFGGLFDILFWVMGAIVFLYFMFYLWEWIKEFKMERNEQIGEQPKTWR